MLLRLKRLEERIVFDAAAAPVDNAEPPPVEAPDDGADHIVVVDKAMESANGYVPPDDGALVVEYDSRTDTLEELQDLITAACGDNSVASVVFAGYGSDGGAAMSLEAVLALAGSGDAPDLATFLDHLTDALRDHGGDNASALDPEILDDDLGTLLEETTGMPFAAPINSENGDSADAALYGADDISDDGADDDDNDDAVAALADENYVEDNNIIHFEESDRVIDVGWAFREPGYLEIGNDLGGLAHKLQMEFTLYKNGEILDLYALLAFQNEVLPMGDNAIGMEIDGVLQQIYGLEFNDGKFVITLYYVTSDSEGAPLADPYYAVMVGNGIMVDVNRFFDGDGLIPNVIFGATPEGTADDVFSLQLRAIAGTSGGESLPGELDKTVNLKFPVDADDGDDDGGDDTDPPGGDYFEDNDIIRFEESDRVISPGSGFRDPGFMEIGTDTGGQADRLLIDFTLYKNGEAVDLAEYLAFQGDLVQYGDSIYLKIGNVEYSLSGLVLSDGKLHLALRYFTTDADGEPLDNPFYGMRVGGEYYDVNRLFDGIGTDPNIFFSTTPGGESGDVFTLKMTATAVTEGNDYLPGTFDKTVGVKFSDDPDDGDDGGDDGGEDPRPDNYLDEYDIIHYEESGREIEAGMAFRDPDSFHLNPDAGGDLAKLEVSFTLLKNGEPVDLLEYLGFQNDVKLDPDDPSKVMMDVLGNGVYRQLNGVTLTDGKLLLTLDYDGDMGGEPYAIRVAGEPVTFVSLSSFFDGQGSPNIVFASTPEADSGDVFTLRVNADPYGNGVEPLEGKFAGTVPITFKKTNDSDDSGGGSGNGGESGGGSTDPVDPVTPPSPPTTPTPPPGSNTPVPPTTPPGGGDTSGGEAGGGDSGTGGDSGIGDDSGTGDDSRDTGSEVDLGESEGDSDAGKDDNTDTGGDGGTSGESGAGDGTAGDGQSGESGGDGNADGGTGGKAGADMRHHDTSEEEEEIAKLYPETMQADVKDVVGLVSQAEAADKALLVTVNTSMAQLGETLGLFRGTLGQMLGILSSLADLTGEGEVLDWIANAGGSHERLVAVSGEHVSMLLNAVRVFRALPPDLRDSIAYDSVAELNTAIDDVNRELRVIIAGMRKVIGEAADLRQAGDASALSARLPEIRGYMAQVEENIRALNGRRDSLFFDLRTSATVAESGRR